MQAGSSEARRYALGLLLAGLSPEEAERRLEGRLVQQEAPTALTDPTNVLMKEVGTMAHPAQRGPVDILGVTTRTNTSDTRTCMSCLKRIDKGRSYERVARDMHTFESYHTSCFAYEFGERRLYGA
jgi:hypothetical protein